MIKDPTKKCELTQSLKPLSLSPRETSPTKNATIISEDKKDQISIKLNMQKIKSSYYKLF